MRETLAALVNAIEVDNPLQRPFLQTALRGLQVEEHDELQMYLAYCVSRGVSIEFLAESYNTIVRDTLKEQLYFQRYGRYRHSTYAGVADAVYQNDGYMKRYMYGLALTSFLWPNHREIHRFFVQCLPQDKDGAYLEIGPGHGVFFLTAMRRSKYRNFTGVDISQTSVEQTRALISSGFFGLFSNYQLQHADFVTSANLRPGFDAVVMGEVLEHVEDPLRFLCRIEELAAPGAFIFVTTAINAPAIDHIYLFPSPESVRLICEQSKLQIAQELVVPYAGLSVEDSQKQRLPVNIAMVLTK